MRVEGNDPELRSCAVKNAMRIGAGHTFIVVMRDCYPVNVLKNIKDVPEVCNIFCATANDVDVVVVANDKGRGIVGVIDGESPLGVETDDKVRERREFLRRIGYKR